MNQKSIIYDRLQQKENEKLPKRRQNWNKIIKQKKIPL